MAIRHLRGKLGPDAIAVLAPTGIAATNVRGMTIHNFLGLGGVKRPTPDSLCKRNLRSRRQRGSRGWQWDRVEVIFIDEVSMVSPWVFELLSNTMSKWKKNDQPFGGLQVVACGDFLQLPPVSKDKERDKYKDERVYCFESPIWRSKLHRTVRLQEKFRQSDPILIRLLDMLRDGSLDDWGKQTLYDLKRPLSLEDNTEATTLQAKNRMVERTNGSKLALLPGPPNTYTSLDTVVGTKKRKGKGTKAPAVTAVPKIPAAKWNKDSALFDSTNAVQTLTVKTDALVMLLKNLDTAAGLVNGAIGTVVGFDSVERTTPHKLLKYWRPIPSLAKTCQNLTVTSEPSSRDLWPVVRFRSPTCRGYCVMAPSQFDIDDGEKILAHRTQIPLQLAWALTIHKSQGQSESTVLSCHCLQFQHLHLFKSTLVACLLAGKHTLPCHEPRPWISFESLASVNTSWQVPVAFYTANSNSRYSLMQMSLPMTNMALCLIDHDRHSI